MLTITENAARPSYALDHAGEALPGFDHPDGLFAAERRGKTSFIPIRSPCCTHPTPGAEYV